MTLLQMHQYPRWQYHTTSRNIEINDLSGRCRHRKTERKAWSACFMKTKSPDLVNAEDHSCEFCYWEIFWDHVKVARLRNKRNTVCYSYRGLILTLAWCEMENMSQYYTSQQIHPYERNHGARAQHRRVFCLDQYVSISEKPKNTYNLYIFF